MSDTLHSVWFNIGWIVFAIGAIVIMVSAICFAAESTDGGYSWQDDQRPTFAKAMMFGMLMMLTAIVWPIALVFTVTAIYIKYGMD